MPWREFRKGLPIHKAGKVSTYLIWMWVIRIVCAFVMIGTYGGLVYNITQLEKENTRLKVECGKEN